MRNIYHPDAIIIRVDVGTIDDMSNLCARSPSTIEYNFCLCRMKCNLFRENKKNKYPQCTHECNVLSADGTSEIGDNEQ